MSASRRSAVARRTLAEQRRSWNRNAPAWVQHVSAGGGFRELLDPFVLSALGPARGRTFLDAGCGEGRMCRMLADAGAARVVGIDLSASLVRAARRAGKAQSLAGRRRTGPVYRVGDAARLPRAERYDAILSYLSLMHFPDPLVALSAWRRALTPGGLVVAVLPHPFTQSPGSAWQVAVPPVPGTASPVRESFRSGNYFASGWFEFHFPGAFRAPTQNAHRPLSEWSRLFERAGLAWTRCDEPHPSRADLRQHPEWAPLREQPYFLVLRAAALPTA